MTRMRHFILLMTRFMNMGPPRAAIMEIGFGVTMHISHLKHRPAREGFSCSLLLDMQVIFILVNKLVNTSLDGGGGSSD